MRENYAQVTSLGVVKVFDFMPLSWLDDVYFYHAFFHKFFSNTCKSNQINYYN